MNLKLALEKNIDELENLKELVGDSWLPPRDTDYCANQYYYYYVNHVNSIINSDPYHMENIFSIPCIQMFSPISIFLVYGTHARVPRRNLCF